MKRKSNPIGRHSPQVVELSQRFRQAAVQSVSKPPAASNGDPIYRFLGQPTMRTCWMAGAAPHKGGDICHKHIHGRKQMSIRCTRIEHWVLLETAHPRTTKQLTRTYNTANRTSQTYNTQSYTLWYSYTDDHREQLIAEVISNSDHITLTHQPECQRPHYNTHHHQMSPRCLTH